jgi:predicted TIM-barrel fold metal-dependent hydrolase
MWHQAIFHMCDAGLLDLYGVLWGEDPNRSAVEYSAFQNVIAFTERAVHDTMAALVLHNLFGRFPEIQVLTIELGSKWVPPLLSAMDRAARMSSFGAWPGGRLSDLPSEIFRHHVFVTPYHEDDIGQLVRLIGADRVLFGSDYPHPEGMADPGDIFDYENGLSALGNRDLRRIFRDNAAGILRIGDDARIPPTPLG